jgi:hypothetical protein
MSSFACRRRMVGGTVLSTGVSIAIRDIPGLGTCIPESSLLETLSEAMEKKGEHNENKPFRVRKAAYDVVVAARDGWLKSSDLRNNPRGSRLPKETATAS